MIYYSLFVLYKRAIGPKKKGKKKKKAMGQPKKFSLLIYHKNRANS
jgi:hypothetical protein